MTEAAENETESRLIRMVLEMRVASSKSENDVVADVFPALKGAGCGDLRVLSSCEVPRDTPTAEELNDLLALWLLTQFPNFYSSVNENIIVVNMLTTALGAALSFPLRNNTPGTSDGPEVVEVVLRAVRSIAESTAVRAAQMSSLISAQTPGVLN